MTPYWEWRDKDNFPIHLWTEDGTLIIMSHYETRDDAISEMEDWKRRDDMGTHNLKEGFPEGPYTLVEVFE